MKQNRNKRRTITCGKCKKKFTAKSGNSHNARTCKVSPPPKKVNYPLQQKNSSALLRLGQLKPVSGTSTKLDSFQTSPLEQEREGCIPPGDFMAVWVDDGFVTAQTLESDDYINFVAIPEEWAMRYEYIEDEGDRYWFNEASLAHRENAPAIVYSDGSEEWYTSGKRNRLNGPAVNYIDGYQEWWVDGTETENFELCEKAADATCSPEELMKLCSSKDYVVRQIAAHHPRCPEAGKVLAELLKSTRRKDNQ